jgi:hypothetical protein
VALRLAMFTVARVLNKGEDCTASLHVQAMVSFEVARMRDMLAS